MGKLNRKNMMVLVTLVVIALLGSLLYLLPGGGLTSQYILELRLRKLVTYFLVAVIASFSTISFQTVTSNRFLTPSVLGLESLYVFMQSFYLFFYWRWEQSEPNTLAEFVVVLGLQCGFFALMQPMIKRFLTKGFGTILLIAMSFSTLLRSLSTYMQVLMDPNEYDKLQSKLFASLQSTDGHIIWLVAGIVLVMSIFLYRQARILDVFYLGKENAQLLGINVNRVQRQVLWAVVILTSASTAMVGPMAFFGFVVVNLTYLLSKNYQHKWLFSLASLIGFLVLLIGQGILERVLHYSITISMIVELLGGALFFYLIYKERIKS